MIITSNNNHYIGSLLILTIIQYTNGFSMDDDQPYKGSRCAMSSVGIGICKVIHECSWAMILISSNAYDQVREATCLYEEDKPIICCPETPSPTSTTTTIVTTTTTAATTTAATSTASTTMPSVIPIDVFQNLTTMRHLNGSVRKSAIACDKYNNTSMSSLIYHIINGLPTVAGEFPHMVALGYESQENNVDFDFKCGGSLISEKYVLTAAHCVFGTNRPMVGRLGRRDIKTNDTDEMAVDRYILNIIIHPLYQDITKYHDIALIELNETVQYTDYILPACLHQDLHDIDANIELIATGWGVTSTETYKRSDHLLKTKLSGVTLKSCNAALSGYRRFDVKRPYGITTGQICAGDPQVRYDTCTGDSGGPLQIVGLNGLSTIVGITSYGYQCRTALPGIYTRVAFYLDWIESIVWRL